MNNSNKLLMNFLILFLILFVLFSCDKNENNPLKNSGESEMVVLDTFIVNNFMEDAKQLYMHEIYNDSTHFNYNNSIIDTNEINKILNIIQMIYHLDIPERDTVFEVNNIHARYCYEFNNITIQALSGAPEINNMLYEIIPTGDPILDSILLSNQFEAAAIVGGSIPGNIWITIRFTGEQNMVAIGKKLLAVTNIFDAKVIGICAGDGNTISIDRNSNPNTITFSIGKGDCPAGCGYHKYWEFSVSDTLAEFIRSYEG